MGLGPSKNSRKQDCLIFSIAVLWLCGFAKRTRPAGRKRCRRAPRHYDCNAFSTVHFPPSTVFLFFLLLAGCGPGNSTSHAEAGKPLAGVKLRLVVVNDPAIATAVRGLRDEWNAQTGAELEVIEATEKDIADAAALPGDAVICPAHLLGPLAEAKRLAPVPRSIVRDPLGPWSQTFELLRNQEAVWGSEVYGVPLGSPVLCCYYRANLLEKLHRPPPRTWKEYEELARLLRGRGEARWGKVRNGRAVGPRLGRAGSPGPGRVLRQGARQLYDAVR